MHAPIQWRKVSEVVDNAPLPMAERVEQAHLDVVVVVCADCVRGLPAVFDVRRKRWVAVESASAEQIEAQIRRCPSGALQFVRPTAT